MTFDVASVRESKADPSGYRMGGGFQPYNSSHLHVVNFSLMNLLQEGYASATSPLEFDQIDFGRYPRELKWFTLFTIDAKADPEADAKLSKMSKEQVWAEHQHMVQALLEERFKLKVHWEDRPARTYDLVVAKSGRLLSTGEPPTEDEMKAYGDKGVPALYQKGSSVRGFEYVAHGATTADIAELLTSQFGQQVNDKTGLTGKYYFHLKTYQVRAEDRKMDETNPWPPLENAVEDQLGLKLVRSKGVVRTLVVDHVERPSEN